MPNHSFPFFSSVRWSALTSTRSERVEVNAPHLCAAATRAALIPLLAALALAGCTRDSTAPAAAALPPLVVEVAPVAITTEAVPIDVTGVLSRRVESTLAFKTGGVIATVAVRAGDRVTRGQSLATLRLDEIDAAVAQARTALEKTRRDLARVEALHADRVATLENLQDARSAVEVAAATLRAAEFNREHSVVVAPADGRILRRTAEPDELAAPGRPILAFAADDGGWVAKVGVTERDVLRLHVGDRAELVSADGATLPAVIAQIAEGADPATRTIEVELALDSAAPAGVRSGFIVNARLHPQLVAARPVVPLGAIVEGHARQAHVFTLAADGRNVRRQPVEIEAIHDDRAYLRTPLPAGTRVVTTGAEFLSDGRTVSIAAAQR
ncbi:MAG: efflux RND transporter periplasmic adaptor subunit [Opitutae bacterium]|nr:efflux RND transporter periplasmic adaptor subunit [Opitutae bacterium]